VAAIHPRKYHDHKPQKTKRTIPAEL